MSVAALGLLQACTESAQAETAPAVVVSRAAAVEGADVAGQAQGGASSDARTSAPAPAVAQRGGSVETRPLRAQAAAAETIRLAFVGDLALSLQVGINLELIARASSKTAHLGPLYPFGEVAERLRSADLLVGNLECVASPLGHVATWHNAFRCAPNALAVLKAAGFDALSVANNHSMDFGPVAFGDMLKRLHRGGLAHCGAGPIVAAKQTAWTREIAGVKVGLLGYYWPPRRPFAALAAARSEVDVLVAFMHWGREGQREPLIMQRKLARQLVSAGVDLVVGTHAHVMQPTQWIDGRFVAYGLGNFVFSGMGYAETARRGAVLEVEISRRTKKLVAHRMLPTRLNDDGAPVWLAPPDAIKPEVASPTPPPFAGGRALPFQGAKR